MPDFPSHVGTIDPRLTSTVITSPDQQHPSISATFTPPTLFPHGNPERLKTLIKCLQATLPPEIAGGFTPRSIMDPTTRMFTSQFHRLVLYSLANNVDGDEYLSSDEVIRYVQQQTTQHLHYLIKASTGYSHTAIVHALFRLAIKAGHSGMVDFLLSEGEAGIEANQKVDMRRTAIELASERRRKEVVRVLSRYGADASKTIEKPQRWVPVGALELAIWPLQHSEGPENDPDLLQAIIEAGGIIHNRFIMDILFRNGDTDSIRLAFWTASIRTMLNGLHGASSMIR